MTRSTKYPLEVRLEEGELDEVVCRRGSVHLERLGENEWWLAVTKDGKSVNVWLNSQTPIVAKVEET